MNSRISPVRKIKEGSKATYYEVKTACARLAITIFDDEKGNPARVAVEPKGGGCEANLTGLARLTTLCLECCIREDEIIDQLSKVFCLSCKSKQGKGENVAMSCSRAIGDALKKHIENGATK